MTRAQLVAEIHKCLIAAEFTHECAELVSAMGRVRADLEQMPAHHVPELTDVLIAVMFSAYHAGREHEAKHPVMSREELIEKLHARRNAS